MPPSIQPVSEGWCSFRQQQLSKRWHVVTSGQVSGQLSHQQKHGCSLQSQWSKCGSLSWQQSQQVSQLLLQVAQSDGAALQVPLSAAAGAGAAGAGAVGAGAAGCAML